MAENEIKIKETKSSDFHLFIYYYLFIYAFINNSLMCYILLWRIIQTYEWMYSWYDKKVPGYTRQKRLGTTDLNVLIMYL